MPCTDEPGGAIAVEEHSGPRADLRSHFELAEDSSAQLDAYADLGRVLVAADGDDIVGHVQITETGRPAEAEIKNMAVDPSHQRRGIGRALIARRSRSLATKGDPRSSWPPLRPTPATCASTSGSGSGCARSSATP